MVSVYVSEWGMFEMPKEIRKYLRISAKGKVKPVKGMNSRHFWNWLYAMEVQAGKPKEEDGDITTLYQWK
jgi:hypothetical protein